MYKIFVDSDLDVTPKYAKEHGLELLRMPFIIDEKVYYPYSDSDDFNFKDFYKTLAKGVIPKTSALNLSEYLDAFEPVLKDGFDILYIHFSSAMSGTFQVMDNAKVELLEKYPDRRIETIDTLSITAGGLNIIEDLVKYKEKYNPTIDELKAYADTIVQKYAIYFFATDLKFFKRSGRISNFAGFMGDIIGLKPIIYVS
ncbi:MAG: DegV family protein, partial [Bacilli bacterium]